MGEEREDHVGHNRLSAKDLSLLNIAIAATQRRVNDLSAEIESAEAIGVTLDEVAAILDEVSLHAQSPTTDDEPT